MTLGLTEKEAEEEIKSAEKAINVLGGTIERIDKFKKEMGVKEDDLMNGIENGIVDKMNGSIEEALLDSTTLIEKQEVL